MGVVTVKSRLSDVFALPEFDKMAPYLMYAPGMEEKQQKERDKQQSNMVPKMPSMPKMTMPTMPKVSIPKF